MWKQAIVVLFALVSIPTMLMGADSPVDKGSLLLGGGALFSTMGGDLYESGDDGITILVLAPAVGTFVARGFSLGSQFILATASQGDDNITAYGIGPRVAYYFSKPDTGVPKGKVFPYLSATFMWGKLETDDEDSVTLKSLNLGGGFTYMVSNSIGLYSELSYRTDSLEAENDDSDSGSSFNVMIGFSLFIWE